jgi:hypothetical protein
MILIQVLAQVALTFGLLITLARSRVAAIRSGAVKMKDVALRQDAWPDKIRQIGASCQSQLELPTLFFALIALAAATSKADAIIAVGAWLFVATRYVQAYIHTTTNFVPRRFQGFAAGVSILGLMWIYFAARILID